jgi:hypothetical protein
MGRRPATISEMRDYAAMLRREGFYLAAAYWDREIMLWGGY